MNGFAFQYAVLRYIHDPVTQEFINVGVVVYSSEARYIKMAVSTKYSRLSCTFQQVNGEHHHRMMTHIEHRLAQLHIHYQQFELLDQLPPQIELVLHQVLPPDDSSLVFGGYGGGLTADLDAELTRLYERLVERYMEKEDEERRSDDDVWQVYRRELDKHNVTIQLAPVTLGTTTYQYKFDHAWKNQRWHPIEPVSFDMVHEGSILEKANKWIGRAAMLEDSKDIDTLYLLLGAPHRNELRVAYEKATRNMRDKIHIRLELIQEHDAPVFSERLAKMIESHQSPE